MRPNRSPTRRLILTAASMSTLARVVGAQPNDRRRIAFLTSGARAFAEPYFEIFRHELLALGYSDANLDIEARYAEGNVERLSDFAAGLVQSNPEVLVASPSAAAVAAKRATSTIPIVIVAAGDPVATGLVASLARPGANITGLSSIISYEVAGKWLQLLKTTVPDAERVAVLLNPANSQHLPELSVAKTTALTLRTELLPVEARDPAELDRAFNTVVRGHAQALMIPGDPMFLSQRRRIIELAASQKLPAIYGYREFVVAGGLMSYGIELKDVFRRAATYVDKILKGAKPGDLPVEQPTKLELAINQKTARSLDLTFPPLILAAAAEVIE